MTVEKHSGTLSFCLFKSGQIRKQCVSLSVLLYKDTVFSLIALAVVAAIAGTVRNRRLQKKIDNGELDAMPEVQEVDAECCGQHEVCEKESLLAAVSKKIEYYDDEELDKYIGTAPDEYTPEQEDEFRDVFYTMQSEDVAGWVRSLQLRGIALPDNIKDEVFLIVGERRNNH